MRRRKIWYKRHLFKNHFKSYKDWDNFNPSSDFKHPIRYRSDALICRNADCPREQMPISEHEAYYYFAKRYLWKRIRLRVSYVFMLRKIDEKNRNCYVCPFCGGGDVEEFKSQIFVSFRNLRSKYPRSRG